MSTRNEMQPRRSRSTRMSFWHIRGLRELRGFLGVLVALSVASVAAQDRPDRSRPPALGPAPQLNLPPIQKRTLSNGLAVWVIETHKVPLVQANLVVLAGSGDDPAGKSVFTSRVFVVRRRLTIGTGARRCR